MAFFETKDEGPKPMRPIYGFIVFVIVGAISAAVSGSVLRYVTTNTLKLGALGLPVLPINFPPEWPSLLRQGVVGLVIFLFLFVIAIIFLTAMLGATAPKNELDVDIAEIRKVKAKQTKR